MSFFGLFPIMFLSGTLVPVESLPGPLEAMSLASPLRHYLDATLGIFFKRSGLRELWPQALTLLVIGVPLFAIATYIFSRSEV